jgi:membrane associated rhomboid family serine protease
MLPRIGSSKLVSTWLMVTAAASIVAIADGGWLASWTALSPKQIWHGQVWRLVTWIFVEPGPWNLAFTCACIYKFGGELAPRWGDRRLQRFMLQIVVGASVAAALVGLLSDLTWNLYRCGGVVVSDTLIIAWARQYPNDVIRMFGFIELGGQRLVVFTVGITILIALASSPFVMVPELVACLAAAAYPRSLLAR